VEVAQAHREGGALGVLLLNLDRFKNVNDILGHAAGDGILVTVGERLRGLVKEGDTVSSMGGDEFAVLVPRLAVPGEMGRLAREILASLREPFEVEGQRFYLTASIGISVYPLDGEDQWNSCALPILPSPGQGAGGDGYSFYAESMNQAVSKKLVMENGLRRALEREEFALYYNLSGGEDGRSSGSKRFCVGGRGWNGDFSGEFNPLAEETGLILPIGEWVLHKACRQNRQWRMQGFPPVEISVNISALQVARGNLVSLVAGVLERQARAVGLAVEITENILMEKPRRGAEIFRALDDMGVRIYIDDSERDIRLSATEEFCLTASRWINLLWTVSRPASGTQQSWRPCSAWRAVSNWMWWSREWRMRYN
jgi:diguanylate cyclase (GGDEF)-like protein